MYFLHQLFHFKIHKNVIKKNNFNLQNVNLRKNRGCENFRNFNKFKCERQNFTDKPHEILQISRCGI